MMPAGFETQYVTHEIYTAAFSVCIDGPGLRLCRCNSDFTLPHISQYASMFNWPWGLANHVGNQLSNSTSIPSKPFTPEQSVGATLTLIV